jgi:hypothetical protein
MINHQYQEVKIVLSQADFDRAVAEMSEDEFRVAWGQLGKLVRIRAKRIKESWRQGLIGCLANKCRDLKAVSQPEAKEMLRDFETVLDAPEQCSMMFSISINFNQANVKRHRRIIAQKSLLSNR